MKSNQEIIMRVVMSGHGIDHNSKARANMSHTSALVKVLQIWLECGDIVPIRGIEDIGGPLIVTLLILCVWLS